VCEKSTRRRREKIRSVRRVSQGKRHAQGGKKGGEEEDGEEGGYYPETGDDDDDE
jgi:hypothetical protein